MVRYGTPTSATGLANRTSVATGTKTITSAGTGEVMPTQVIPDGYKVMIKALNSNTDAVHIADTKAKVEVDANAYELQPDEFVTLNVTNLNILWLDANVNGEGVTYTVET